MPAANKAVIAAFLCSGLQSDAVEPCLAVVRGRFGRQCTITPLRTQGGCSYSLVVGWEGSRVEYIVQFRAMEHAVSPQVATDARRIFGALVPRYLWFEAVRLRDEAHVQVCAMSRLGGVRVCDVQSLRGRWHGTESFSRQCELMLGMADFFARAWKGAQREGDNRGGPNGRIGRSIGERLELLSRALPTTWLRSRAGRCKTALDSRLLESLPVVLNHGDLLPSNVMVDERNGKLTGLVDWAEAEWFYFGMTLYGIEHLLGYVCERRCFQYYRQADELRGVFWRRLQINVSALNEETVWNAMMVSRETGILLWHGIAWNDGKLDRVVDSRDEDVEELACLEAFLRGSNSYLDSKL